MKVKLLHDWKGDTKEDAIKAVQDFLGQRWSYSATSEATSKEEAEATLEGVSWIFGSYTYANYSGDATMIFKKNGVIYENGGGHCSCHGLEGQWAPTETNIDALMLRIKAAKEKLAKPDYDRYWDRAEYELELETFLKEVEL